MKNFVTKNKLIKTLLSILVVSSISIALFLLITKDPSFKVTNRGIASTAVPQELLIMYTDTCPSGWTRYSDLDSAFLRGSSTPGGNGGSTSHSHTYSGIPAHTHTAGTLVTNTTGAHTHTIRNHGPLGGSNPYPGMGMNAGSWYGNNVSSAGDHTHTITGSTGSTGVASPSTENSEHLPPYLDIVFCYPTDTNTSTIPSGSIFLFETLPGESFSRFTQMDSKFPRGSSIYGSSGGSETHTHIYTEIPSHTHGVGTLATSTAGAHTHNLRAMGSLGGSSPYISMGMNPGSWYGNNVSTAGAHTHTISGDTGSTGIGSPETESASHLPPYIDMIFGQQTVELSNLPIGTISPFSGNSCPNGWSSYSDLDNLFPRGSETYGGTGGSTSHTHSYSDIPTHLHSSGTLATDSAGVHTHTLRSMGSLGGSNPYVGMGMNAGSWHGYNMSSAGNHSHTISGNTASTGTTGLTTDSSTILPPYKDVLFCILENNPPYTPTSAYQYLSDGTTVISTGDTINETTVILKFNISDPDNPDTLTPKVEIREVGTSFSDIATHTGDPIGYTGSVLTASITISGLSDLSSYHWQSQVCDLNGDCSEWISYGENLESDPDFSIQLNAQPNVPQELGPSNLINGSWGNDDSPTLSFELSDPDLGDQVRYQIQIDNDSDFSSVVVDYISALDTQGIQTFTVGQAQGGGTYNTGSVDQTLVDASYYWRVKAIDENSAESAYNTANSGNIAFKTDVTAPGLILNPSSSTHSLSTWSANTEISVSWEDGGDTSGSGVDGYSYVWDTNPSTVPNESKDIEETILTLNSPSLSHSNSHYFHIRAVDNVGNWGETYHYGPFFIDTTPPTKPGTPTTNSPTGNNKPTWTWTASSDTGVGLATTPYTVYWCNNQTFTGCDSMTSTINTNSFTQPTSLADGTWYFRVSAKDQLDLTSEMSSIGSVFIDTTPPTKPGTPTTNSPTGNNKPTWTWTASSDTGVGLATTPYTVYWCNNQTFTGCDSMTSTINTNSFTQPTSLTDGTWYFRVRAKDKLNFNSEFSNLGSLTINTKPPVIQTEEIEEEEEIETIEETLTEREIQESYETTVKKTGDKTQYSEIKIRIKDDNNQPIPNLPVTLGIQTELTDIMGIATFRDIISGDHQVKYVYNNKETVKNIKINTIDIENEEKVVLSVIDILPDQEPEKELPKPLIIAIISTISLSFLIGLYIKKRN